MKKNIIVNGHSDYPIQVFMEHCKGEKKVIEKKYLPACIKGGVNFEMATVGGDFSVGDWDGRKPNSILQTLDSIHREIADSPDCLKLVLGKKDLETVGTPGTLSMMLNLEGTACITSDFGYLRNYYRLGVRALSLTHNERNIFADGCAELSGGGLSEQGRQLVKEINQYGMVLDLVHINERGFFEALDLTERPVLVSHSNAKKVCNVFRNLTDDQLKALAARDGVVGLNFIGFMIDQISEKQTIERLLDHLDYIVDLIGIDHVGFGPDFIDYWADIAMESSDPNIAVGGYAREVEDISATPIFVLALAARGYSEDDRRKIMGGNFLRIYREGLPD